MKLTNTRDAAGNGIKMLVYGGAGVGKTTLIKTCPGKPLILSAEAGLLSLAGEDIDVLEIKTLDTLNEAYVYLRDGEHTYEWICLDSISEIAEVVLHNEMSKTKDPRKAYGELGTKVGQLLRSFRDLPGLNVYFSATQRYIKDDAAGTLSYGPGMPGQALTQSIPYIFDEVFCLRAERNEEGALTRVLQTQPDARYTAKDRSGKLEMFEAPNLTTIHNAILN